MYTSWNIIHFFCRIVQKRYIFINKFFDMNYCATLFITHILSLPPPENKEFNVLKFYDEPQTQKKHHSVQEDLYTNILNRYKKRYSLHCRHKL